MDYALTLDSVVKRFGTFTAVGGISMRIPKGCIYGWLGQNGAGKTTTIRMVMSIFYPTGEHLGARAPERGGGQGPARLPAEEKGLYKKMKAGEIDRLLRDAEGHDRRPRKKRARDLLDRYGLGTGTTRRARR
jgi:ABC-2 type transport system ATP-binding protein